MPCHHSLDEYVHAYLSIDGFGDDKKAFLFRTAKGRGRQLSTLPMSQADVYRMVGRRATAASVDTKIGCHSFRATGITNTCEMAGNLRSPSRWPTMKALARPGSPIEGRIKSHSTRSNGSEFEAPGTLSPERRSNTARSLRDTSSTRDTSMCPRGRA